MVPLGHTNKAACGVKLLPATDMYTVAVFVLYSTHSGSFPVLMDGLTRLWLPPTPNTHPTPSYPPTPIELIHDIGGVQKKVSQNPAVLAR